MSSGRLKLVPLWFDCSFSFLNRRWVQLSLTHPCLVVCFLSYLIYLGLFSCFLFVRFLGEPAISDLAAGTAVSVSKRSFHSLHVAFELDLAYIACGFLAGSTYDVVIVPPESCSAVENCFLPTLF